MDQLYSNNDKFQCCAFNNGHNTQIGYQNITQDFSITTDLLASTNAHNIPFNKIRKLSEDEYYLAQTVHSATKQVLTDFK